MPEANLPERQLRASDADREAIVARLREAVAEGRLSKAEHLDRLDQLHTARTYGELDQVTGDLPLSDIALEPRPVYRPSAAAENLPPLFAMFSGSSVRPTGPVHGVTVAMAVFGGVTIDLRNAEIAESGIDVNVLGMFGGIEIVLPIDANVKVLGVPLFGGVTHRKDDNVRDGPLVNIRAMAVFGGVTIKRKPPRQAKTGKSKGNKSKDKRRNKPTSTDKT